ncbi:hypothetical protein EYC84_011532 [Monilinia fructicola]|uniref:Uncharacterized protein n=1 Tax=Monilinia fructicola TaxID=38448 RepID=A0A5M9J6B1_MONFR|nr:hypothetical protein EYC84_011532 [Monilinia fructicola]
MHQAKIMPLPRSRAVAQNWGVQPPIIIISYHIMIIIIIMPPFSHRQQSPPPDQSIPRIQPVFAFEQGNSGSKSFHSL